MYGSVKEHFHTQIWVFVTFYMFNPVSFVFTFHTTHFMSRQHQCFADGHDCDIIVSLFWWFFFHHLTPTLTLTTNIWKCRWVHISSSQNKKRPCSILTYSCSIASLLSPYSAEAHFSSLSLLRFDQDYFFSLDYILVQPGLWTCGPISEVSILVWTKLKNAKVHISTICQKITSGGEPP